MTRRILLPILGLMVLALSGPSIAADKQSPTGRNINGVWMPTAIGPDGQRNRTWPADPPFLPPVKKAYDEFRAGVKIDPEDFDEERNCLPYGMPYNMLLVAQYPLEIVQTNGQVTIIFELHNDARRIYLDGRKEPSGLQASWMGFSTGHWEGDTLVVKTTSVRDGTMTRPHGPQMVIQERLHLISDTKGETMLEDEITIDDPGTYSEPIVVKNYFRQHPGLEVGEYFCSEDLWRRNLADEDTEIPWR